MRKKNVRQEINVHKADSFSLGLTVLAVGNLIKIEGLVYDWGSF